MPAYLNYSTSLAAGARIGFTVVAVNSLSPYTITIKFKLSSLAETQYLLGRVTNILPLIAVNPNGSLSFSNGTVSIDSTAGKVTTNTVTWVRVRQDTVNIYLESSTNGTTFTTQGQVAKAGGFEVDTPFCINNTLSKGNFLYSLRLDLNGVITEWNESSAPLTGTTWPPAIGTGNITLSNFTGVPADSWWIATVILATLKYWTGSAWVRKPLKYWNGSAWVQKVLKYWNGTAWVNK